MDKSCTCRTKSEAQPPPSGGEPSGAQPAPSGGEPGGAQPPPPGELLTAEVLMGEDTKTRKAENTKGVQKVLDSVDVHQRVWREREEQG